MGAQVSTCRGAGWQPSKSSSLAKAWCLGRGAGGAGERGRTSLPRTQGSQLRDVAWHDPCGCVTFRGVCKKSELLRLPGTHRDDLSHPQEGMAHVEMPAATPTGCAPATGSTQVCVGGP